MPADTTLTHCAPHALAASLGTELAHEPHMDRWERSFGGALANVGAWVVVDAMLA